MYKILLISIFTLFFSACSSKSEIPLTKVALQQKVVGHILYNNHEAFYIFDNGTFLYEDKDNSEKKRGSWYIRSSKVNYKNNRQDDMICLAIGKTKSNQFGKAPCSRLFLKQSSPDSDDLYTDVSADCDVENVDSDGNIQCNFIGRTFMFHRVSKKKFYDE